jgi:hypothetical protein
LQALEYNSISDGAKRKRGCMAETAITMPAVCVIFEHHSEATVTTNRLNFYELLEGKK